MNCSQILNISRHLIASAERLDKLASVGSRHALANQFADQAAELRAAHDAFLLHCLDHWSPNPPDTLVERQHADRLTEKPQGSFTLADERIRLGDDPDES